MKKLLFLTAFAVFGFSNINAQESSNAGTALSEGSWIVEANTGSWTTGSTAFSLASSDGNTAYSIGAEAGYFVMDDLAVKVGLGYADDDFSEGNFVYKVGVKYYLASQFPVGIDFTGASSDGNSASWVGLQGGYAWFVAPNISIEPTIRYNVTLDDQKADSAFQGLIGFALHF